MTADSPQRVRLSREKGWRKPEGVVVVSRPSKWGNPFPIADPSPFSPEDAVRMYRDLIVYGEAWWTDLAGTEHESRHRFWRWHGKHAVPTVGEIRTTLTGKDLACWCPLDHPCHADVLLQIANGDAP